MRDRAPSTPIRLQFAGIHSTHRFAAARRPRITVNCAMIRLERCMSRVANASVLGMLLGIAALSASPCQAESAELRISRSTGIGYLQIMVMEHERLIEKHARARGLGAVAVRWTTFADATGSTSAMLSGSVDIVAGGLGSFVTLWERTRQTLGVKGIAALDSMPMLLVTRNPSVRDIRDLGAQDRIAVPGVKVSSQAATLQFAAAQAFGDDHWNRLDPLTVNLGHPTALQLLLQGNNEVTTHFASPPFQDFELRRPGIRTILNSYDVWGGPQTFGLVWTTSVFRDENPGLYAAFFAALEEATYFVNHRRHDAAAIYVAMASEAKSTSDDIVRILANPQIRFTLTPQNTAKFAMFKADKGLVAARPVSWKDLFFPEVHKLPGS
jgi:sulfonate transport system substrate-binding protein